MIFRSRNKFFAVLISGASMGILGAFAFAGYLKAKKDLYIQEEEMRETQVESDIQHANKILSSLVSVNAPSASSEDQLASNAQLARIAELESSLKKSQQQANSLRENITELSQKLENQENSKVAEVKEKVVESKEKAALLAVTKNLTNELKQLKSEYEPKLSELIKKNVELTALVEKLEKSTKAKLDEKSSLQASVSKELEKSKQDYKNQELELTNINRQLSRTIQDIKTCQATLEEKDQVIATIPDLEKQLIKAKNDLMLKETEVKSLTMGPAEAKKASARRAKLLAKISKSARAKLVDTAPIKSDVMIAEVTAPKVNLRSGPGKEHAPIMQVQNGTRLTVEDKQGDWYRVLTPTGSRAFVRGDMVRTKAGKKPTQLAQRNTSSNQQPASDLVPFGTIDTPVTRKVTPPSNSDKKKSKGSADEAAAAFERIRSAMGLGR